MKSADTIRITKEFRFEMAHALYGYDGPCRNIHGHSYELSVTVMGAINSDKKNPKFGMVMDYSDLKKLVNERIIQKLDHALVINKNTPHREIVKKNSLAGKVVQVDFQPTCENLLVYFTDLIKKELPTHLKLHHLKLRETPSSFAEWFIEDNYEPDQKI